MLELRSVDAGYGSFQALFGVSLEVKAGEAVGVIGPNGAGKTTLMRVISGLIRPRNGSIAMEGTDVLATPAHRIVSLGIAHVPENRRLFPRLTVDDNLRMGAFMQGARAGYAERREDPTDRRRVLLSLSRTGDRLVSELREGSHTLLRRWMTALSPDELEALARGWNALADVAAGARDRETTAV